MRGLIAFVRDVVARRRWFEAVDRAAGIVPERNVNGLRPPRALPRPPVPPPDRDRGKSLDLLALEDADQILRHAYDRLTRTAEWSWTAGQRVAVDLLVHARQRHAAITREYLQPLQRVAPSTAPADARQL
jgi:hypothetical protein